ncbi:HPP family protein [Amycolatopsis sp. NPDC058278]|uniref:CBS domain-containing protein n=1 Tax=Amycolatopsis sp. NPDC058278 TaxID=3346417 RepID=UPI0036DE8759
MRARDLMTAPVITVHPWTSAKEAAELLSTHGFTALPAVDDDERLVGIVTRGGSGRWKIDVRDGHAHILDQFDDDSDRHVAQLQALAVPGVVAADTAYAGEEQNR